MPTERDSRLTEDTEANWTLFTILDSLRKEALQASLLLRGDLDRRGTVFLYSLIARAQLLEVVGRQETRMQSKLTHASEQAENVGLDGGSVDGSMPLKQASNTFFGQLFNGFIQLLRNSQNCGPAKMKAVTCPGLWRQRHWDHGHLDRW